MGFSYEGSNLWEKMGHGMNFLFYIVKHIAGHLSSVWEPHNAFLNKNLYHYCLYISYTCTEKVYAYCCKYHYQVKLNEVIGSISQKKNFHLE